MVRKRGEEMTKDVEKYFFEQYEKASFKVPYGHWPDFETKRDAFNWIQFMEKIVKESEHQ